MKTGRETLGVLAGREALAIALVLATTVSGLGSERAIAQARRTTAPAARPPANLAEAVFAFGDDLEAVNYDQGERRAVACRALLTDEAKFESALQAVAKAEDIAADLRSAAQPTIELCFNSLSSEDGAEAKAAEGFAEFHERAFDFAAVASP